MKYMKYKILILLLVISLYALSFNFANSNNIGNIILVSDNSADQASAVSLANVIDNYEIVITKWGKYDKNIINKIKNKNPKKVYVIGGNKAISYNYNKELSNLDINYIQLAGANRIITNKAVMSYIYNKYYLKKHDYELNKSLFKNILIIDGYNIQYNNIILSGKPNPSLKDYYILLSQNNKTYFNKKYILQYYPKKIDIYNTKLKNIVNEISSDNNYFISKNTSTYICIEHIIMPVEENNNNYIKNKKKTTFS